MYLLVVRKTGGRGILSDFYMSVSNYDTNN